SLPVSEFTAEARRTLRTRRGDERECPGPPLRILGVLRVSAVKINLIVKIHCLLFFILFVFVPPASDAQTGDITGRVVTEDGVGMSNVTVYLNPVATDRRPTTGGSQNRTTTDEDGNFKFTGLAPRVYSVGAVSTKGYVQRPVPISERQDGGYHRVGANV